MIRLAALLFVLGPSIAHAGAWDIPPEGSCVEAATAQPGGPAEDAPPAQFKPGDVISHEQVSFLRAYLPDELWEHRERFFYDGMRLEIGPCYRDYAAPAFFVEATQAHTGRARLAESGDLDGHVAGLPFAPETFDAADPKAALKWAWNWVNRYQGAGEFGNHRLSIVDRQATLGVEGEPALHGRWEGDHFWVRLHGRADRPNDGYRFPSPFQGAWAGGGKTRNLDTGNTCAFRQYGTGGRRHDLFFYNPELRKVVRGQAYDAEAPLTACLTDAAIGGGLFLHGGSPQLHDWTLIGVRDLLAPINTKQGGYPEDKDRNYGPWGISFSEDRWELRRVVVIEGDLKEGSFEDGVVRFRWYLDLQTLFPLYYASYRDNGEPGGVGHFVGRWSEDRADYPAWPDDPDRPVRVIDGVGEALVDWNDKDAVRIESWNNVSTPPTDKKLKRLISQSSLRGR